MDNASTDGTVEYLRSLPGVRLVCNPDNRGFPAGANQGLRAATGRQVLLLNNDTVVTTAWLTRLLRALHELLLVRRPIRLSLCMIVRDNARTIEAALQSIQPWVDEMIVVDTGSTDDTPRPAARQVAAFDLPPPLPSAIMCPFLF